MQTRTVSFNVHGNPRMNGTSELNEWLKDGYKIDFETVTTNDTYFARLSKEDTSYEKGVILDQKRYPVLSISADAEVTVLLHLPGLGFKGGSHTFEEADAVSVSKWDHVDHNLRDAMLICHLSPRDVIPIIENMLDDGETYAIYPIYISKLDWQAAGLPF